MNLRSLAPLAAVLLAGVAQAGEKTLTLSLENVEPLKGQHYEGWNIVDGQAISTGRFNIHGPHVFSVDADGKRKALLGDRSSAVFKFKSPAEAPSLFVLTIEPNGDTDAAPSDVHLIGGSYVDGSATATTDHAAAIGVDLKTAMGTFLLATPTNENRTPEKGIWFVNPADGGNSLNLPKLNTGFAYEGWVVNTSNGKLVSTGVFFSDSGIDSDAASRFAGPLALNFPPVPGSDYVKTPLVLNDGIHAAVVTVEPYPDYDPAPFSIKILARDIAAKAPVMTPIDLLNTAASSVPVVRATLN